MNQTNESEKCNQDGENGQNDRVFWGRDAQGGPKVVTPEVSTR